MSLQEKIGWDTTPRNSLLGAHCTPKQSQCSVNERFSLEIKEPNSESLVRQEIKPDNNRANHVPKESYYAVLPENNREKQYQHAKAKLPQAMIDVNSPCQLKFDLPTNEGKYRHAEASKVLPA